MGGEGAGVEEGGGGVFNLKPDSVIFRIIRQQATGVGEKKEKEMREGGEGEKK